MMHSQDEHNPLQTTASFDPDRPFPNPRPRRYQDSPTRDIISPPPGYASPEPPDSPMAASPSHAFLDPRHDDQHARDLGQQQRYLDETPPLPPPHNGFNPNPQRNSFPRRSMVNPYPAGDDRDRSYNTERGRQDVYSHDSGMNSYSQLQPPGIPPMNTHDQSRGNSPFRQAQRPMSQVYERNSYSSSNPFAGGSTPGSVTPAGTPDARSSRMSERSIPLTEYSSRSHRPPPAHQTNMPYFNSSHDFDPTISNASINPNNIVDDGDDGFIPDPQRRSVLALGRSRSRVGHGYAGAAGVAGATIPYGQPHGDNINTIATNDPVDSSGTNHNEKSAWLSKQSGGNRRFRLWVGMAIGVVILLAIVGAIVGAVLGTRSSSANTGHGNINNAADDSAQNGDLNINSAEIKALMNNKDLHKVFPGVDYTPWGVQYPACLTYPPSQNNVTRDMAVLSQLTNTVRLYGTDCNQTEMVLHAIDRLKLKDMKLWLGVWVDTNQTTTDRQMANLYKLLDEIKDHSILKGVIIGNEALFRAGETKSEAQQELITLISNTRQNFTSLGYDLPLGTSDLGDNWDSTITQACDFVMANIHPFFAGVSADVAASWTWSFWQNHNTPLTVNDASKQQIISETGWPSDGGTDCGGADGTCASGQAGATASIDNLNTFMSDWVCQALANGTDYFWFEAFDEPWKVQYNTPGREWEDKWGLMDSGRNLKKGVKIPDCGGKTV